MPPQQSEKKAGQLEQWQLEQYFDKGFLVLPNFFSNEEMQPAIEVSGGLGYSIVPGIKAFPIPVNIGRYLVYNSCNHTCSKLDHPYFTSV